MENALTILETITNTGKTLGSLVAEVRAGRGIRKKSIVVLDAEIKHIKHLCHVRGIGELVRACTEEMQKTLQDIQQKNYSGRMLDWAMNMLELQYQMLYETVQSYGAV